MARFKKGQRVRAAHPTNGKRCECTVLDATDHPDGELVKLLFDDRVQTDWLDVGGIEEVVEYG